MMNVFIAVAGLPGSGKSTVCDYLREKHGFEFVRFGQITLDLAQQRWGEVNQEKERIIREEIRAKHGMAAFAIMNMEKFNDALARGNLVGDDIISWEEYQFLKQKFGDKLVLATVVAGKMFRYKRLINRAVEGDVRLRFRSHTIEETKNRDTTQLENCHQGPTIALADYFIINQGSIKGVYTQIEHLLEWINKRAK